MKNLTTLFCLFLCLGLQAQNHDDVAIIINQNSPTSMAIGEYFQTQRDIPNANVIRIEAPTTEAIALDEVPAIFEQIKTHINDNSIEDNLNYLVTTKGLPYIVEFGEDCNEPNICKASLESKLSFLLSESEEDALSTSPIINPYFEKNTPFSRAEYGMFLVHRLDGYTQESVFDLIDRSASQIAVEESEASIVLDIVNVEDQGTFGFFDNRFMELRDQILASNWNNVIYDADSSPVPTQESVSWYNTTGFGPYDFFEASMNWVAGSVASSHTCKSAFTFEPHQEGKIYLVDFIEAGATGAVGFVENTYASNMSPTHFYQAYFVENRNLAEANFSTMRRLGNGFLSIGDPKMSILVESPNGTKATNIENLKVYPNPSIGQFWIDLNSNITNIESIEVINALGVLVYQDTYITRDGLKLFLDLSDFSSGWYQVVLKTNTDIYQQSVVIEH